MPLRFMGTSPDSSSLIPMLTSLCEQIAINYEQNVEEIPDEVLYSLCNPFVNSKSVCDINVALWSKMHRRKAKGK